MLRIDVKHIHAIKAGGRTYLYHRVTRQRLPDDPIAAAARAQEINRGLGPSPTPAGSFNELTAAYRASPEFKGLKPRTQNDYRRCLDIIGEAWGTLRVDGLQRKGVMALRDAFGSRPARGNQLVGVARLLLSFARDRGYRPDNPARGIKPLRMGEGHKPWPPRVVAAFKSGAGPEMRLALFLGLYTGQRLGDVLRLSWHDYDGEWIAVAQSKTGEKLAIPVHPDLKREIDKAPRRSPIVLTAPDGRPYSENRFHKHFRKEILASGLDGYVFHGLRYTAAGTLADLGCTTKEIMAITGHASLRMVEKYTRGADQKKQAKAAILKWSGKRDGNKTVKRRRT